MKIKAVKLVWITVSNLEKAEDFFSQVLELPLALSDKKNGWLEFSTPEGFRLGVLQWYQDSCCASKEICTEGPGTNAIITMEVEDLVAVKSSLESKLVQFLGPIMELPGHVKLATFVDPDGNKFQLMQIAK